MKQEYYQLLQDKLWSEQELVANFPAKIKTSSMDKVTFLMQEIGDQLIHFFVELDTRIDLTIFEETIKQVISIEPILIYNFKVTKRDAYWQLKKDFRFDDLWSVFEGEKLREELKKFIFQDLDVMYDLPIHIRIFRTKHRDLLCLKVSHAAMDAAGIQELLAEISSIYSNLANNPAFRAEEINMQTYDRSVQQVLKEFNLRKKMKCRRQTKTPQHTWAFPWIGKKTTGKNYSLLRIPATRFKKIKKFAKKHGTTINDILVTAYYRAMFTLTKPEIGKQMTNTVTINLRKNLTKSEPKAMCNLSVGVFTQIPYHPDESFEQTLMYTKKQMNEKKKQNPGIGIAFTLEIAMKIMNFKMLKKYTDNLTKNDYKKRKTHPIFTNIGIINGDKFSFQNAKATDAYFVTPIMNAPGFILGMSTFEDVLTVSFGFYEGSYDKKLVDKFLNYMSNELPK